MDSQQASVFLEAMWSGVGANPVASVEAWWLRHRELASGAELPFDRAALAAAGMDRLGYAFASGYHEALRQLVPGLGQGKVALCATEAGGNHPRAIATELVDDSDGLRLDGSKSFVTLGNHADELLIVARQGEADGRPRLRVIRVPATRDGVVLQALPETPFVPEVPHASVRLSAVAIAVEEVLPGDGYARYVKPFRTVEDVHVHGSLLAWLFGVGRRAGWEQATLEGLSAVLLGARALATADPSSPAVHLALSGVIARTSELVDSLDWGRVDEVTRDRWQRDRALLSVAGKARGRRRDVAWQRLAGP